MQFRQSSVFLSALSTIVFPGDMSFCPSDYVAVSCTYSFCKMFEWYSNWQFAVIVTVCMYSSFCYRLYEACIMALLSSDALCCQSVVFEGFLAVRTQGKFCEHSIN